MTVKELLSACEMRIDYIDIDDLKDCTSYVDVSERDMRQNYYDRIVSAFDYDAKTNTLALTVGE